MGKKKRFLSTTKKVGWDGLKHTEQANMCRAYRTRDGEDNGANNTNGPDKVDGIGDGCFPGEFYN